MVGQKPIRLPPLKTLRVHNPKRQVENPCIAIMSSVLGRFSGPLSLRREKLGERKEPMAPMRSKNNQMPGGDGTEKDKADNC